MKNLMRLMAGILSTALLLSFAARTASAQDPLKVAPEKQKLLLENDKVRVYEVLLEPGEKLPMHSHPPYVVYFLSSFKMKTTTPDGKLTESEIKAGDARWSQPVTHANENVGTTDGRALVVELKEPMKMEKMEKK